MQKTWTVQDESTRYNHAERLYLGGTTKWFNYLSYDTDSNLTLRLKLFTRHSRDRLRYAIYIYYPLGIESLAIQSSLSHRMLRSITNTTIPSREIIRSLLFAFIRTPSSRLVFPRPSSDLRISHLNYHRPFSTPDSWAMNQANGIPNRLAKAKSPYLLQHAYNPVVGLGLTFHIVAFLIDSLGLVWVVWRSVFASSWIEQTGECVSK